MIDNNRVLERIVEEIQGVIARMDENDLERAMALITKGSRIYAAGEGRSGFQARSFAMRMMHIGYMSYMMGKPSVRPCVRVTYCWPSPVPVKPGIPWKTPKPPKILAYE